MKRSTRLWMRKAESDYRLAVQISRGREPDFAVETRYPGDNATKRQASSALRWADKVRTAPPANT